MGSRDRDRSKDAEIYVINEAAEEATFFISQDDEAHVRLSRVAELIEGFETPYGLELLSTVHWLATQESEKADTPEAVIRQIKAWNSRKAGLMKELHILTAWRHLSQRGWLSSSTAFHSSV